MKVYLESLGCDSNKADTNRIAKYLVLNNVTIVRTPKVADFVILMSCGFNKIMLDKNTERIKTLRKATKARLLLGGCVSKIDKGTRKLVDFCFGPRELDKLDGFFKFKKKLRGVSPDFIREGKKIIRIATGCSGKCSYCVIKFANGGTRSRKVEDIKEDIESGLRQGIKKFVFTGEDVGSWGQDLGKNICDLIKEVVSISGDFTIQVTTINPRWFILYPDLFGVFKLVKIAKKVYLPLQSGSPRILKLMRRGYGVREYVRIFNKLKSTVQGIQIESDILVGFPTESEKDYDNTSKIVKELDISFLQVFVYTDMEGAFSSGLAPKVPFGVAESRARKLMKLFLDKHRCENRVLVNTNLEF